MPLRLAVAAAAALLAGLAGWRLRWLTATGALAAAAVGACILGLQGWSGAAPLLTFFVTSTLLGRLPGRPSHGPRTAAQVLANGGVAAAAAAAGAWGVLPGRAALAGALAAANADTWATEIGSRWGGIPRRLGAGRPVGSGDSGGMTALGSAAGCAGAVLIAVVAGFLPAAIAGTGGMLADSLLGGTAQAVYRCPRCGARSELPAADGCGVVPVRVAGLRRLNNDGVNLAATVVGAALAVLLHGI